MKYNPDIRRRRSIRLKEYDSPREIEKKDSYIIYTLTLSHGVNSQPGAYFITICVHNRECLLGEIKNGKMELNIAGQIVKKWWLELPHKFPNIKIDEHIIMPNHFHAIITILETNVGADLRVCPNNKGKDMDLQGEHIGVRCHDIVYSLCQEMVYK